MVRLLDFEAAAFLSDWTMGSREVVYRYYDSYGRLLVGQWVSRTNWIGYDWIWWIFALFEHRTESNGAQGGSAGVAASRLFPHNVYIIWSGIIWRWRTNRWITNLNRLSMDNVVCQLIIRMPSVFGAVEKCTFWTFWCIHRCHWKWILMRVPPFDQEWSN